MIVSFGIPDASIALPNASSSSCRPFQLRRSARASKGLALACTPLSPTLGSDFSPSPFQSVKMALRSEPSVAARERGAPQSRDQAPRSGELSVLAIANGRADRARAAGGGATRWQGGESVRETATPFSQAAVAPWPGRGERVCVAVGGVGEGTAHPWPDPSHPAPCHGSPPTTALRGPTQPEAAPHEPQGSAAFVRGAEEGLHNGRSGRRVGPAWARTR
eukprot:1170579-Prymnesium_polylepis.1